MHTGRHRVGVVAELPAALLECGVDPHDVLAAAEVPADLLRDPENFMDFPTLGRLFEAAVAATGRPHFGLLVGRRGGIHSLGLVGRLMATAPTVKDAILDLCVNQVRYIDGAVTYLSVQDGFGLWGYTVQVPGLRGVSAILDGSTGVRTRCLEQLANLRTDQIRLSRDAPVDVSPYRIAFGVTPDFNAEQTCIVLSPEQLAAPVRTADPSLRRLLQNRVIEYWARAQPTVAERVRRALAAYLSAGEASLDAVAAALGLGPRTLTRKLQAEGTNFRSVLEIARHDVARHLLGATRMPVTDIGIALGYESSANFTRAFRRTVGAAPSEWRRAYAAAGAE